MILPGVTWAWAFLHPSSTHSSPHCAERLGFNTYSQGMVIPPNIPDHPECTIRRSHFIKKYTLSNCGLITYFLSYRPYRDIEHIHPFFQKMILDNYCLLGIILRAINTVINNIGKETIITIYICVCILYMYICMYIYVYIYINICMYTNIETSSWIWCSRKENKALLLKTVWVLSKDIGTIYFFKYYLLQGRKKPLVASPVLEFGMPIQWVLSSH